MKLTDVKEKAVEMKIKPGRKKKQDLIREIQRAEGNFDCYATAEVCCDQYGCLWRKDCLGRAG